MNRSVTISRGRATDGLNAHAYDDLLESNGPFENAGMFENAPAAHESFEQEDESTDDYVPDVMSEVDTFTGPAESFETYQPLSEAEIAREIENQVRVAKASKEKKVAGRINWAKGVLNRNAGLNLSDDNLLDEATKNALGDFQRQHHLPLTARIDSATERALLEADALFRSKSSPLEPATIGIIGAAKTKIEDWTKKAVNNKPRLILNDYRDPRKVYAVVLHQMAFKRRSRKTRQYSDPESYLATGAHFCILFDGRIIQLHPCSRMIWHGNCVSPGSVGVEFEGNFPDIRGRWWINKEAKVPDKDQPTQAQFVSGRFLASYLKTVLGTTHVLAHRQSSDSRENDPGPDVWYQVGQWAIDKLGLSDGGAAFKCGKGNPILSAWRTWGIKSQETSDAIEDHECAECESPEPMYVEPEEEMESFADAEDEHDDMIHSDVESETIATQWAQAVKVNRYYGAKLGWSQYVDRINDMLLPYSGFSNVSLGEEAFAEAVSRWQERNGFTGKDADGIIGPNTWKAIRSKLKLASSPTTGPGASVTASDVRMVDGVRFKRVNKGWAAYGGGPLTEKLYMLRQNGKLFITPNEIEMFHLVSKRESDSLVNAVNSWDNMYMSMGFLQLTIRYYELAQVIKRVPDAFRKHGIELDPSRKYFPNEKNSIAIKNAPNIEDLRSFEWAKRFFNAGLEEDIIVAQIEVARSILKSIRSRFDRNNYLDRFNDQYPNLWAFIYESHNSRPAPFNEALKSAIPEAAAQNITSPAEFGRILVREVRRATKEFYSSPKRNYASEEQRKKKIGDELAKVERIIEATKIIK